MVTIALILAQSHGSIQFVVDAVEPCQTAPTCLQPQELLLWQGLPPLKTLQTQTQLFAQTNSDHQLLSCLELAYGHHYPLVLTPDCIWLTIAQGFSSHVNQHYQQLRQRLVEHTGKKTLQVLVDGTMTLPEIIARWLDQMAQALPKNLVETLQCDFSTTTSISHIASQIVLMEGFQAFFDYDFMPICGIPNITLLGTPADWRSIAERVQRLAVFDLEWWTERLAPICEGLILTSEGQPPHSFWQQIYHQTSGFCDDKIDGWIIDLFPYIKAEGKPGQLRRNPMLAREHQPLDDSLASTSIQPTQPEPLANLAEIEPFDPEALDFETESTESGLAPWIFPSGLAKVTTTYREHIDGPATKVRLVAGLIGTGYNRDTNQLSPEIGWAVY